MAYIKNFELNNGLTGNYWRITKVDIDKIANKAIVFYSLYASKELRQAGKTALATKKFSILLSNIDLSKDLFEEAYKATKNVKEIVNTLQQGSAFFTDAQVD